MEVYMKQNNHSKETNLMQSVKYGGGCVMLWAGFSSLGMLSDCIVS